MNTRLLIAALGIIFALPATAQTSSGTLWAMGRNDRDQLGTSRFTTGGPSPRPIVVLTNVVATAGGGAFTLAVMADGTLWGTGDNGNGELGDGSTTPRAAPVQVANNVRSVSAGMLHSLHLKSDGSLWGTGLNTAGQIGDGFTPVRSTPVQISSGVATMAAGAYHSLFVKTDGTLWAMGNNRYGEIAESPLTTSMRLTPVQVTSGVAAVFASCAGQHSLYLKTDGTLWGMGRNESGQLGDGSTTDRSTPVQIATSVVTAAAGSRNTYFIKADGTLWATGSNEWGQLGNGTHTSRTTPIQIATGVAAVAAGDVFLLYVKNDGTLCSAGINVDGALGDGTTVARNTPLQVATGVTRIAAGVGHALFIGPAALPPVIAVQPANQTAAPGDSATLAAIVTGAAPMTLQWRRDGTAVPGATSASYRINSVQAGDAGAYSVVATNSGGTATSATATLTVGTPGTTPTIVTQPASRSAVTGASVTFSVEASGTAPLTYQWRKDGTNIAAATNATYTIASAQNADAGSYTVVVTNPAGSVTSSAATLMVTAAATPPVITTHPVSQTVTIGQSFGFTVAVNGESLTYQWRKDGVNVAGATSRLYEVGGAQLSHGGTYTVVVTNGAGSVTSNAALLTVNSSAAAAPVIAAQPANITASAGSAATFHVSASGTTPLGYQWLFNGTPIAGATAASYTIGAVQASHAGNYSVRITNSIGTLTSNSATLAVSATPDAPAAPVNLVGYRVAANRAFQMTLTGSLHGEVSGTDLYADDSALAAAAVHAGVVRAGETRVVTVIPLAGASAYAGSTRNGVTSASAGPAAGSFAFAGAGAFGTTATMAPIALPGYTAGTHVLAAGGRIVLPALATGGGPYTYQWYRDGIALAGATLPWLLLDFLTAGDAGVYSVDVTNLLGTLRLIAGTLNIGAAGAPVITTQPLDKTVFPGGSLSLTLEAAGGGNVYQWFRNGAALAGQTRSSLFIPAATAADSGSYTATVNNSAGSHTTRAATVNVTPEASRLVNISCRAQAGAGQVVTPGFFIAGTGTKQVLVRAVGPGLAAFGLPGTMPNPQLRVFQGSTVIAHNDDWEAAAIGDTFARLGAFGLPAGSRDAALLASLPAGREYTVQITDTTGQPGIVLIEVYDADSANATSRFFNVSVRGTAGTDSTSLVLGFVIRGTGQRTLLVRGAGPALAAFGVPDTVSDPQLSLFSANGRLQLTNAGWNSPASAGALVTLAGTAVGAFPFSPTSPDAATLVLLAPALYTVQISSRGGAAGEALAEVYDVP